MSGPAPTGGHPHAPTPDVRRAPHLVDRFGRVHRDLRVSLTDRCNLRCTYCMPAEGLDWLPSPDLLDADELVRLVRIATELGIREVRLTGGEPLVRPDVVDIVARIAALPEAPAGLADDQRPAPGPVGRATGRGGPGPGQRLLRHPEPRDLHPPDPARPPARRARRHRGSRRGRPGAGQGQHRAPARRERPRGWRAAALGPGRGPVAAVHRADAPGPPARLEPGDDGLARPRSSTTWPAPGSTWRPSRSAARPRPRSSSSTAVRPPSGSSDPCPARSAGHATGCG